MMKNYFSPQKSDLERINIKDIDLEKPDLKDIQESKAIAIGNWMINWIEEKLKNNIIKVNQLLPTKPELAYFLGVSIGTVQNALRYIEDLGYVESKQCIGTMIRDRSEKNVNIRKLTSKREKAVNLIKNYIIQNNYKCGQILPSSRLLTNVVNCSLNTTRLALENLCTCGILERKLNNKNEMGMVVKSVDFQFQNVEEGEISGTTLVEKVVEDLKNYIEKNLSVGEKMPVHAVLSDELKVSVKTVHDGLKVLITEGILLARRGRYGTVVVKMPNSKTVEIKKETSIFALAKDTEFYFYEKTQSHIKKMIAEKYQIGEKLPSIIALSKELDLSPNTIRKAFHNLAKEGYLAFSRGRYGGTFVIDIPETEEQAFKWLAVNPKYAELYNN